MNSDPGPPSEFALIARYFAPLLQGFPGAYGLRDDAAVISPAPGFELVAKTDAIIGGIDFPPDEPADLVAREALRVNLSDLAAKGAIPRAYMVDLMLPRTIGDAALGLAVLRDSLVDLDAEQAAFLTDQYRLPQPRVQLGPQLIGIASAALDVSDGLVADLRHICEVSNLAAVVEASRVPLSRAAHAPLAAHPELLSTVLTGGDDYEILFTARSSATPAIAELSQSTGVPMTQIGRMVTPAVACEYKVHVLDGHDRPLALASEGWTHF